MALKTLLPLPSNEARKGGWSVDVNFTESIRIATEPILNDIDEIPTSEQVEAVLLAANAYFVNELEPAVKLKIDDIKIPREMIKELKYARKQLQEHFESGSNNVNRFYPENFTYITDRIDAIINYT
jgi:hypothetical protein